MRILWMAPYVPWPADHGGKIRLSSLVEGLEALGHEVELWARRPANPGASSRAASYCFDGRSRRQHRVRAVLSPLPEPAWENFDPSAVDAFVEACRRNDVVIFEQSHMGAWARHVPAGKPLVVDTQNVETQLTWDISRTFPRLITRLRLRWDSIRFRRLERRLLSAASLGVAVSEADAQAFRRLGAQSELVVVPSGVDIDYHRPASDAAVPGRMLFTGTLGYAPNLDAMLWFCDEVLPRVRSKLGIAHVQLVGGCAPDALQDRHSPARGIELVGYVPDVRPYMAHAQLFLIPLRMGGGTRLKAVEAMAAGVPIVSTSLGVAGINLGSPPVVTIADGAEAFAEACVAMLADDVARREQAGAARGHVVAHYAWPDIALGLHRHLQRLVAGCQPTSQVAPIRGRRRRLRAFSRRSS